VAAVASAAVVEVAAALAAVTEVVVADANHHIHIIII
jgi:hypothetical protein